MEVDSAPRNNSENHEPMEVDGSPVAKKEKGKLKEKETEKEELCNGQDPSEDENSSQDAPIKVNGKKEKDSKDGETNGIQNDDEESNDKKDKDEDKKDNSEAKDAADDAKSDDAKSEKKENNISESNAESDSKDGSQSKAKTDEKKDKKSDKALDKASQDSKETNGEKEPEKAGEETKKKTPEEIEKEEEEKKKEMEGKKLEEKREKFKMFDNLGTDTEDMRPMAGLLYSIGADLAKQHIFKDLLRVQTKKKAKNLLQGPEDEEQLEHLKKSLDELVDKNKRFSSEQDNCSRCQFRTESQNVMEWHLEFAHGTENNIYQCCFCEYYSKYPADFFFHVEQEHKRKGRIYMKPAFFACPLCPFEHNSKAALSKHKPKCEKNFNLKRNLEPSPTDCDIPLKKLKQLNNPKVVKVTSQAPKPVAPKTTPIQTATNWQARNTGIGSVRMPVTVQSVFGGQLPMPQMPVLQQRPIQPVVSQYTIGNNVFTLVNSQGQFMLHQAGPSGIAKAPGVGMVAPTSLATAGNMVRLQVPVAQTSSNQPKSLLNSQSKSLITNQAAAAAAVAAAAKTVTKSSNKPKTSQSSQNKSGQFEICEICGGFVKDRESLRIHFYWAHKVDINKELFDRKTPHLICEYCPQRFWTYQGYTRHRQMSHKVTSKDPVWKCPVCREDNIANLLTHLNQKHNISLNMICHQKYCPMCGLTFKNEIATKQHLFTAHKQMFEKAVAASLTTPSKSPASGTNPVPTGLFKHAAKTYEPVCSLCDMTFPTVEAFSMHCAKMHVFRCYRCGEKWNTSELLQAHFRQAHGNEQEKCQLCSSKLTIGRPYIRHLKRTHLKECSVVLVKMPQKKYEHYRKKYLEKMGAKAAAKASSETTQALISKVVKNVAVARKKTTSGRAEPVVIDLSDDESKKEEKRSIPEKKKKKEGKEAKVEDELEDSVTMEIDGETIVIQKEEDEDSNPDENSDSKDDKSKKSEASADKSEASGDEKDAEGAKKDTEAGQKDTEDKDAKNKDNCESADEAIKEKPGDSEKSADSNNIDKENDKDKAGD